MKLLSLPHPIFQILSLLVGIFNARMGITRRNFTWQRHRNLGLLYYGMSMAGLAGGLLMNETLEEGGLRLDLGSHLEVGFLMIPFFLVAGLLGFLIRLWPTRRRFLMPIHKYLNLASLLLFVYQGYTGISALFRAFLS